MGLEVRILDQKLIKREGVKQSIMKVLIIEDEKAMGELISIRFRVEGFEVDQVGSFNDARSKLATNHYGAILTDYLLPDGDLIDFLTQLRANPQLQGIPVVVMTNYIEDVNMEQLKKLEVDKVVVKYKVVPAQMVETIKQLVSASVRPGQGSGKPS